jgi:hypothetical protein
MNISFCTVVLSLIQGIALNTGVLPLVKGGALQKVLGNDEDLDLKRRQNRVGGVPLYHAARVWAHMVKVIFSI